METLVKIKSMMLVAMLFASVANAGVGTEDEGYALGLGNGGIMARRVRQQTLDRFRCDGLSRFQDTILRVQRSVRAPSQSNDEFVRGFHRGYTAALRQAIHEGRAQCGVEAFRSGDFPGRFNGGVYCQVLNQNSTLVNDFPFDVIYDDWSGGSDEVRDSCRVVFTETVNACAGESLGDLRRVANQVCN